MLLVSYDDHDLLIDRLSFKQLRQWTLTEICISSWKYLSIIRPLDILKVVLEVVVKLLITSQLKLILVIIHTDLTLVF